MHLKFLDEEEVKKLLEGEEDILTNAYAEDEKYYRQQECPRCGGSCKKLGNFSTMFNSNELFPKYCMQCSACGEEFDPRTGITIKIGNIGKAIEPAIKILNNKED